MMLSHLPSIAVAIFAIASALNIGSFWPFVIAAVIIAMIEFSKSGFKSRTSREMDEKIYNEDHKTGLGANAPSGKNGKTGNQTRLGFFPILGIVIVTPPIFLIMLFVVAPTVMYYLQVVLVFGVAPILTLGGYYVLSKYERDLEAGAYLLAGGAVSLLMAVGLGFFIQKVNLSFDMRHPSITRPWYYWLGFLAAVHLFGLLLLGLLNYLHGFKAMKNAKQARLTEEMERARREAEARGREDAEREQEERKRRKDSEQAHERRQQEEQERRRRNEDKGDRQRREDKEEPNEDAALKLLGLKKPYTIAELKKRRMHLLKKVHPDQGGSDELTRLVNEAFELLSSKI